MILLSRHQQRDNHKTIIHNTLIEADTELALYLEKTRCLWPETANCSRGDFGLITAVPEAVVNGYKHADKSIYKTNAAVYL